jgi:hypothetical protein
MSAKYSFFEAATQQGFVVACMVPRMVRQREHFKIIVDPKRGRVFQLFREGDPDKAIFEFVIPDRQRAQSMKMWEAETRELLGTAWDKFERDEADRVAAIMASSKSSGT